MNPTGFYRSAFFALLMHCIFPSQVLSVHLFLPIEMNSEVKFSIAHSNTRHLGWIEYLPSFPFLTSRYLNQYKFFQLQEGDLCDRQSVGIGYGNHLKNGFTAKGYGYFDWMSIAGFPYQEKFQPIKYYNATIGIALQNLDYTLNFNGHTSWNRNVNSANSTPTLLNRTTLSSYLANMSHMRIIEADKWGVDFQMTLASLKWTQPFIGAYYNRVHLIIPNNTIFTLQELPNALDYTFSQFKDVFGAVIGIELVFVELKGTIDNLSGPRAKLAFKFNMGVQPSKNPSLKAIPFYYSAPARQVSFIRPYYRSTHLQAWNPLEWYDHSAPGYQHHFKIAKTVYSSTMSMLSAQEQQTLQNYLEKLHQLPPETVHEYYKLISSSHNSLKRIFTRLEPLFAHPLHASLPAPLIKFLQENKTLHSEDGKLNTILEKLYQASLPQTSSIQHEFKTH